MAKMTKASEIAPNVFLGPSPDPLICPSQPDDPQFDVFVEASDLAQIPDEQTLSNLRSALDQPQNPTVHFEVPGSGSIMPPTWSHTEVDGLLHICRWIWETSRGMTVEEHIEQIEQDASASAEDDDLVLDSDGDMHMGSSTTPRPRTERHSSTPRKVLIHCPDGYTESTLLGLTFFMYAHGYTVAEAWVKMHKDLGRNFFSYSTDVALLTSIQARILTESPGRKATLASDAIVSLPADPEWMSKLDGSLPSRILPYMYLGNLNHANNAALCHELGIGRIVSVGERVNWLEKASTGLEVLSVENVQDNGVDSLSGEFERCLEFLGKSSHGSL